MSPDRNLLRHLLDRLRRVRLELGCEPLAIEDGQVAFSEALDSMGLVEFLGIVADDCGVAPDQVQQAAGGRFGTVADLAAALTAAGIHPGHRGERMEPSRTEARPNLSVLAPAWLCATAVGLPRNTQTSAELDVLLGRPPGWLEQHAGNETRRVWGDEDALTVAAEAGARCLEQVGVTADELGALLVTSEAPLMLTGLAASLHNRMGLRSSVPALEIGGACTGFLAAMWTAQRLLPEAGAIMVLAVEAATRWLEIRAGPAGEAAALFGDGTAACLLCTRPRGDRAMALIEVALETDGSEGRLLQLRSVEGSAEIAMNGPALAVRAVRAMARAVEELIGRHGLTVDDLEGVAVHGGNGRMPSLFSRLLRLPPDKVWSETARTGNLGSASLPVAWSTRGVATGGPVAWAAVGSGLQWGAALLIPAHQATRTADFA